MRYYKDVTSDKRSIVMAQRDAASDDVRERLSTVLSHYSSQYVIELELQFDEGYGIDGDDEEWSNAEKPPSIHIAVRAVSPIWGPVEEVFEPDEVPLLVSDLADDDLFVHALDDYNRAMSEEFAILRAKSSAMHERQMVVWKTLCVKHFVIVHIENWKPVAVYRAISLKQASKNVVAAGLPTCSYACTEVRRAVYLKMAKKLPKIVESKPEEVPSGL